MDARRPPTPRNAPCGPPPGAVVARGRPGDYGVRVPPRNRARARRADPSARAAAVVGQERDQDRFGEFGVATQILANLQRFDAPDREIDDDAVGMEALSLNPCFETAGSDGHFERAFLRQFALQVFDQHLILCHDQHLGHCLVFEVAQGHAVLFKETN